MTETNVFEGLQKYIYVHCTCPNLSVSLSTIEGKNAPRVAGPFFCLFVDSGILHKDSAQIN